MNNCITIIALLLLIMGTIFIAIALYLIVYKKKKVYMTLGFSIFATTFSVPFIINEFYKLGELTGKGYSTLWSANDTLSFYGSYLAFIGTSALGALALWQNKKFKDENDKAQSKLEDINKRMFDLENNKVKENLFEMYFTYLDQTQNLFDPRYILGNPEEGRSSVNVFLMIKGCHINLLGLKRRLLFLDISNSDNSFFKYIEEKTNELLKIASEGDTEEHTLSSGIFNFWMSNSAEYNRKSLDFMMEIRNSIFKQNKIG